MCLLNLFKLILVYHIDGNLSTTIDMKLKILDKNWTMCYNVVMYGEYFEITTEIVMKALGCSRQYVSELVKKGRLTPSGKRGKSYTFRFSELSKVLDTQRYLSLVISIDKLLIKNVPELFEERKPGWKAKEKGAIDP